MQGMTDTVTAEHMANWHEVLDHPYATRGQTAEEKLAMEIGAFQYACSLDGPTVPSEAAVRTKIAERAAASAA